MKQELNQSHVAVIRGGNQLFQCGFILITYKGKNHSKTHTGLTGSDCATDRQPSSRWKKDLQSHWFIELDRSVRVHEATAKTHIVNAGLVLTRHTLPFRFEEYFLSLA